MPEDPIVKQILALPGVSGVDIGKDGQILVFTDGDHYYSQVGGVKVTCLKAGKPRSLEMRMNTDASLRKTTWRPIAGGVSGACLGNTAGTLGMRVFKNGEPLMLSNTHIFGEERGLPILQPSPFDGGTERDEVMTNYDFVPLVADTEQEVDAALAVPHVAVSENIIDIGIPQDVVKASPLMSIEHSGRDGYTKGRVISTNGMFKVFYEGKGEVIFKEVIVATAMAKPGASGSIGIHTNNGTKSAVGLLFAGSNFVTLYIPMEKVLKRMGVTLEN